MSIPAGGDPGTGRALARMGGLPPARPDQRYAPPHAPTVPPGSKNVFIGRLVIIEGPNDGLFFYNGVPGRGTLIAAAVAQPGTDPTGQNTVSPVLAVGQWSAITGLPAAQSSVDAQGDMSIQGPDGHVRLKLYTGTGAQNPGSAYFFNDFGAIVQVIDPSLGYFQYQDLGSSSQGALILAQAGKNVSDPVNAAAVLAGVTLANSSGQQLTQITSANGRIRFNNVFGAAVMLIAPDLGGLFFYQDLGSATQGQAIGAQVWATTNVTDPITSRSFGPGFTALDPIAGAFMKITPGDMDLGNFASLSFQARVNGIGATGANRPYLGLLGPAPLATPNAPHGTILVEGTSPDGTAGPQILIGSSISGAAPTPATAAIVEIQNNGTIALLQQAAAIAATAGYSMIYADTTPSIILPALNIPANAGSHFGVDGSGQIYLIGALATTLRAIAQVVGDTNNRWQMTAGGVMTWGSGAAAGDITVQRGAAGRLDIGPTGAAALNVNGGKAGNVFAVGTGPSDFAGTVYLEDTTKPATPGTASALYSIGGKLHYVSEDTNDYVTGQAHLAANPIETINTTTLTQAITGASIAVGAGHYRWKIKIWYTSSAAAGTPQFQCTFPTTAATPSSFITRFDQTGVSPIVRAGNSNAAISSMTPGVGPTLPAAGVNCMFEGEFNANFAAAGTLAFQAATSVAADTFVVQTFYLDLIPLD